MKYDVFISYSSKDQKIVEGLSAYLEQYRIRCFVAYRDIKKGEVWAGAIVRALSESRTMIVVFSDNFNQSVQVDREIELASEDHKPILTFRITEHQFEGVKKYYLKNLNWIDAFPNPEVQFGALKDAAMRLLDMKEQTVAQKEETIALPKIDEVKSPYLAAKSGIKFLSDIDCRICIDDEKWLDVYEDKITFFQLPLGEYKVECCHKMFNSVSQTCFLIVGDISQIYKIVLRDSVVNEALRIANEACKKKDYQLAFTNYKFVVGWNNAVAQFMLGNLYCGGYGVSQNYGEAFNWYCKAAEQGHAVAQYNLGCCYYYGQGTSQNYEEAIDWYRKSAQQACMDAQYMLGYCYYYGQGASQNYKEAVNWFRKSAEQGNSDAQSMLGYCYYYGYGVSQNYKETVTWYLKSAEQGDSDAQFMLGECYYYGSGVSQNYEKAITWYLKSAEQGNRSAQYSLGYCYYKGHGISQNYEKAVTWYLKSAEQGNSDAQSYLGYCYYYGQGVSQNYEEAVKWYRLAAKQENMNAQTVLKELNESW